MARLATLRLLLLGVLTLGLGGTLLELVLTGHYEDRWQMLPVGLVAATLAILLWHAVRPTGVNVRALQILMAVIMAVGLLGVALHFNGAAEFQYEIDPSQDGWTVFRKVIRAKAPPVLAPGLMSQLGVLGLVYVYCHQASGLVERLSVGRR